MKISILLICLLGLNFRFHNGKRYTSAQAQDTNKLPELKGEGTYACAFSPAFDCKANVSSLAPQDILSSKKSIGKVFIDDDDEYYCNEEFQMAQSLYNSGIDKSYDFIYFAHTSCYVDAKAVNNASKGQCSAITPERIEKIKKNTLTQFKQLILPDGDITFHHFIKTSQRHTKGTVKRIQLILDLENIFLAVDRMVHFGFVHQDIKISNVVVPAGKSPKLIDIGVMVTFADFYNKNNMLGVSDYYTTHPIEYRMLFYANNPENKPHLVAANATHVDILMQDLSLHVSPRKKQLFERLFIKNAKIVEEFKPFYQTFYNDSVKAEGHKGYIKVLEQAEIHKKSDVYSLGSVLFFLESFLMPEARDDRKAAQLFDELVVGAMHPNPYKRLDIKQFLDIVRDIKLTAKT